MVNVICDGMMLLDELMNVTKNIKLIQHLDQRLIFKHLHDYPNFSKPFLSIDDART